MRAHVSYNWHIREDGGRIAAVGGVLLVHPESVNTYITFYYHGSYACILYIVVV